MAQKKPLWKRALRAMGLLAGAFVVSSAAVVLLLRFVPVPIASIMIQRRVESWFDPQPYTSRHDWVPLDDIAPSMGVAIIAAEDQNFPDHFGFDWKAIEKAIAHNEHSRRKRGASTVSQQTAKNLFLWESRSWVRKGCEAYFTLLLETLWSKRRILEVYMNIVEFGDGIFGVEAASRTYFGKPAKKLRPSEAALLAAVLPNPHKYRVPAPSPYIRGHQAWILGQMRSLGGPGLLKSLGE
ncbi:MAG TPA: monofunctional biosynthetic peptidoglycan transglycosylase [Holophaga sp.]|nr:monofunctional biosynthetic peptidoglycan transglycosylase [Holophaga sp.]